MSSSWNMKQGPNFAPAYQVSGTPFVLTASNVAHTAGNVTKITFPHVTRWVTITATDGATGALRIGFSENGVNSNPKANYYLLQLADVGGSKFSATTGRLELRCKELYIRADGAAIDNVSVIAGLTGIESFPVLTGSNGFKGVG